MPSKSEILKRLNKGLGLPDKKEFDPTLFALKLSKQVAATAEGIKAIQESIVKQLSTNREADIAKQQVLEKQYGELIALQTKLLQAIQERKIEKVTVERVVERPPESVKVNLAYPDQANRDEERRGLFARLKDAATDTLNAVVTIIEEIRFSRTEKGAIAVRLVTANGEDFYNAVMTVVGGGSSASAGGATDVSALLTEATFTGRIGEVQANPTANTLLGRLKSLEDKIDTLQTELNQKYEGGAITANLGTIADVATQTTLALIKAKTDNIPAQGQALAAGSTPVVLTAAQLTTLISPPDIDVTTHTNYARKYYTNAGAVTDGIIWSPAAGKRWHVVALYIQVSAAATVTLEDDKAAGDDPVFKSEFAANSGTFLVFPEKYPMASGEDAADLLVTTSAGNIYIMAVGYEI